MQEVVQGGVAVGSALEEETRGLEEGLLADVGDELLEDGGPLGVGDAVEGLPGGLDASTRATMGWVVAGRESSR